MSPHILYEARYAAGTTRLVMGGVCLIFVVLIFGLWLPRVVKFLVAGRIPKNAVVMVICFAPIALGVAPLMILVTLITNPTTFVTDIGVTSEGAFFGKPVSFAWKDIDHVECYSTRNGRYIGIIKIVASDGQTVEIGNGSGADLDSIQQLMQDRLGAGAMHFCAQKYRG